MEQFVIENGAAIVTGTFTLLSGVATYLVQMRVANKKIEAQNNRKAADYFLQKKADGLTDLLGSAEQAYSHAIETARIASKGNQPPAELVDDGQKAVTEFERAIRVNRAFLDDASEDTENLLEVCRRHILYSADNRLPEYPENQDHEDWEHVKKSYEDFSKSIGDIFGKEIEKIDQAQSQINDGDNE